MCICSTALPFDTEIAIAKHIIKNNIVMKDGYIEVNTKPGLGIDVDETYLNKVKI